VINSLTSATCGSTHHHRRHEQHHELLMKDRAGPALSSLPISLPTEAITGGEARVLQVLATRTPGTPLSPWSRHRTGAPGTPPAPTPLDVRPSSARRLPADDRDLPLPARVSDAPSWHNHLPRKRPCTFLCPQQDNFRSVSLPQQAIRMRSSGNRVD
jgi:hypothetical protein